jgi:hypothetical protein
MHYRSSPTPPPATTKMGSMSSSSTTSRPRAVASPRPRTSQASSIEFNRGALHRSHDVWKRFSDRMCDRSRRVRSRIARSLNRRICSSSPMGNPVRLRALVYRGSTSHHINTTADDPESTIASIAKRLDQVHAPLTQLGIQFVQVGDDAKARRYLEELDDELANIHKIRDMVDTTASSKLGNDGLSGDALVKVLVGAVNRRIDRKGYGSLQ